MFRRFPALLFGLTLLPSAACNDAPDADDPSCVGAKCDDLEDAPPAACDGVMTDMSGRGRERVIGGLADPIADLLLDEGDDCPTGFAEVMAKLRRVDDDFCPQDGDPRAGIITRAVSERSQLLGRPDSYRLVVTRSGCGELLDPWQLTINLFGVRPDQPLPQNVELIGFDPVKQAFNYYEVVDGRWRYFGDSLDMLSGPGAGAFPDQERRCAACHGGGGLLMKEFSTPWLHWEGVGNSDLAGGMTSTPGVPELIASSVDLGQRGNAQSMESLVAAGNAPWSQTRAAHRKAEGTVADLLRPVFCTEDVTISAFREVVPVGGSGTIDELPLGFFGRTDLASVFPRLPVATADYDAAITAAGQRMVDASGQQLLDGAGRPLVDTVLDFAHPTGSAVDALYIRALSFAGVLDFELVDDIASVDFTRPLFSQDRCDLLAFAPELSSADRTAAKIRLGFIDRLTAAAPAPGTAAADFLAALATVDGGAAVGARVDAYLAACAARPPAELMRDAVAVASLRRRQARELPVLEFAETFPVDDLQTGDDAHFDPVTCLLVP